VVVAWLLCLNSVQEGAWSEGVDAHTPIKGEDDMLHRLSRECFVRTVCKKELEECFRIQQLSSWLV
jgi:hypothetical protein